MSIAVAGGATILITLNGRPIDSLLQASLTASNCFSADSFSLTFAVGACAVEDLDFWAAISTAYVEVSAATDEGLMAQVLITGMVDTTHIDPIQRTVVVEGRDLSSSMIDSYRQQEFINQTASEVVSTIAQSHGLSVQVVATSDNVGRYYGDGYTRLSLGQFSRLRSDWDLVVQLARENRFDVFVSGTTLFFQPPTTAANAPVLIAASDVRRIRVERTLSIAPSASARVQSWNSHSMAAYDSNSADDVASPTRNLSQIGNPAFLFPASNFTLTQVTNSANRYTAELNHLAEALYLEMPWDFSLGPRQTILLCGTDSRLDKIYQIDNIERHYSSKSGSTQSIRAVAI